jgi:hypothetical protein
MPQNLQFCLNREVRSGPDLDCAIDDSGKRWKSIRQI